VNPNCIYVLRACYCLTDRLRLPGHCQTNETITDILYREPTNDNQRLALDYRQRQLCVLSAASLKIKKRLDRVLTFSSFCQHASHTASGGADNEELARSHQSAELLSLECAFDWLNLHYPDLFNAIVSMISEDQEESLPLNWAILVDDWDHTYWTVWIFTVWLLWAREGQAFRFRHSNLSTWLLLMNE
jgi:histone-lysine N-methyltransferase SETD3